MAKTIGELFANRPTDKDHIIYLYKRGHTAKEIRHFLGHYYDGNPDYRLPTIDEINQIIKQNSKA